MCQVGCGSRPVTISRSQFIAGAASTIPVVALAQDSSALANAMRSVAALERSSGARIGLLVLKPNRNVLIAHRADERFPLASTQKIPLVMAVLSRDLPAAHTVTISRSQLEPPYSDIAKDYPNGASLPLSQIYADTISHSDNTGADALAALIGGPAAVTAYLRSIGITGVRIDRTERQLPNIADRQDPRDTATPAAMADLLWRLAYDSPLPATATHDLLTWMRATTTGDKRIRAGVPRGWQVADKTGSYGNGANDIGLINPLDAPPFAIAVYVFGSTSSAAGGDIIANTVRAIRPLLLAAT